jgi:isoleucyl-tRNA synthetase
VTVLSEKKGYKDTLKLPKTTFPMKGSLPKMEPGILDRWYSEDIYSKMRTAKKDNPKYVLHDGPPYANGHVHLGTALNKILKDFILKSKALAGFDVPYVPGWDCHGMPIEHQVTKNLGDRAREMEKLEIRLRCRKYAEKFQGIQKEEFKRLGVLGEWENPYLTMSTQYEAAIVDALADLVRNGYVYRGLRPIHWCPSCSTALAEAELEYHDHKSPSIYVRFPVRESNSRAAELFGPDVSRVSVVIWTTTPWTIPANLAISVHGDFEYSLVEVDDQLWILASELIEQAMADIGVSEYKELRKFKGEELESIVCRHPMFDRDSLVIVGEHVTLDVGTGCVHTAPGHGVEDYEIGLQYKLPILSPVDQHGRFTNEVPGFVGQQVFEANMPIVKQLEDDGYLLSTKEIQHSYPFCWRCKNPLIFRATSQWFMQVDHDDMRKKALDEIEKTGWIPRWGHDRIRDMVEKRPDWCLSRQRAWGVPIPAFFCAECEEPILEADLITKVRDMVAKDGSDVWFETDPKQILGSDRSCKKCGAKEFKREENILDVWFDSSCSQRAVLTGENDLNWPCDLYLEATDQHRGWFQVSLLTAIGTKGAAPYKAVLTHGLILDEKAKKMSKSLGNVVNPQDVIKRYGADILRLLFSSVDYTKDVSFSLSLLDPISESYRKLRNTIRFMLGNLADFNPNTDVVAWENMRPIDQWAIARFHKVSDKITQAYENFHFHVVYRTLVEYCIVDLSAHYLDILKDTLYADGATSPERRSAQTALDEIARGLILLMAPVLCFTAEEAWEKIARIDGEPDSIMLTEFSRNNRNVDEEEVLAKFEKLLLVRTEVQKELEAHRKEGKIGSSLEASVNIKVGKNLWGTCEEAQSWLELFFIVSSVNISCDHELESEAIVVEVDEPKGKKCNRCWNYRKDVGLSEQFDDVCGRCAQVLQELN